MSTVSKKVIMGSGAVAEAYEIEQSLIFDTNASLVRTPSSTGNRKKWTISVWVKKGKLGQIQYIYGGQSSNETDLRFSGTDTIEYFGYQNSAHTWGFSTARKFRDVGAWYHIVAIFDSANGTQALRARLFVNGEELPENGATSIVVPENQDSMMNLVNVPQYIGKLDGNASFFNGNMAEFHFLDGAAKAPTDFAETNSETGQWVPIEYTGGSYGTNGFYLKFASGAIGTDSSGESNNYTATNLANADVVIDTPTNNFCTMDASSNAHYVINITGGGHTLKYGNLRVDGQSDNNGIAATIAIPSSGKWYWEFTFNAAANGQRAMMFGIYAPEVANIAGGISVDGWYALGSHNGDLYKTSAEADFSGSFGTSDVLQVAVDMDNGAIYFGKNNTWANSGDPTSGSSKTGAGGTDLISSGYTWVPAVKLHWRDTAGTFFSNFGQSSAFGGTYNSLEPQGNADANGVGDFYYAPPSGYLALCTSNLPDPAIPLPSAHFNTVLYTGNGSTQSISGVGHQPDLVWIKNRAATDNHKLTDAVRGVTEELESNTTDAEVTNADGLTAFASNGFALGDDDEYNTNSEAYVAWNWKANGAGSQNTDGSVNSTATSANQTAGFSIVTFTVPGSNGNHTVGHGLGQIPELILLKRRDSTSNWLVHALPVTPTVEDVLQLNTTSAVIDAGNNQWGTALPTSSVFGFVSENLVVNNATYVAYCFASKPGFSKIGVYTSNDNADGPFVNLGFRPAWLMIKKTSAAGQGAADWVVWDSARTPNNTTGVALRPSSSGAEIDLTAIYIDMLSNGFKIRGTGNGTNDAAYVYLYMAFAEAPFKYANAR